MHTISLKIEVPEEALSALIKKELKAALSQFTFPKQEKHPEIMNMNEACVFTSSSKSLLYKLTASRKIPHSKRGKKLYFKREELLDWMTEDKVSTQEAHRGNALSLLAKRRK